MEFFEVGGCVRDEIMGLTSKDIDFTVVIEPGEIVPGTDPFDFMATRLSTTGFKIWLESPEFLTVRAMFPKGHKHERLTADFVLARKESDYTDGRRPDRVEPGTLMDDLARRDFTMNAIAKAEDGTLIDPFDGQKDIEARMIRCVGDAEERFTEDALRILRALRFQITKGFSLAWSVEMAIESCAHLLSNVSKERQREEVEKMMRHDTLRSLALFSNFPMVAREVFTDGLRLSATMRER